MRIRYSTWDGTQLGFTRDAEEALDELSRYLMEGLDLEQSLDRRDDVCRDQAIESRWTARLQPGICRERSACRFPRFVGRTHFESYLLCVPVP